MSFVEVVQAAFDNSRICETTRQNLTKWLTVDDFSAYRNELEQLIKTDKWDVLEDRFYKIIEFGTGGRRGGIEATRRPCGAPRRRLVSSRPTRSTPRPEARTACSASRYSERRAFLR